VQPDRERPALLRAAAAGGADGGGGHRGAAEHAWSCGSGTWRARGSTTTLEIPPALPLVWGDPHQLQQVFLNILLNAEQALRAGGSALRVVVEAEDLGGEPRSGAGWLQVTLSNDGPPIPASVLPHIFDPFFTTKGKEGTGLGLAICRRIVTEHGGSIDAETGEWGTRFRILLPAHAPHASVSGSLLGTAAGCRPRAEPPG
jgi:signal transduction histidine kinase